VSIGRVREVPIARPAALCAERIGEPDGRAVGVRFYYWERLEDAAARIVQHHRRATDG
jgi:hypothetical protein